MGPQRSPLSRVVVVIVVVVVVVVDIGVRRLAVANGPNIFQMLLVYQIILRGDRGACEQLARVCYVEADRPRFEPATF